MTTLAAPARTAAPPAARAARRARVRLLLWRPEWIVFAAALAARLTVNLRHGMNDSLFGYDAGVYFAGSDALLHGRLPYADYWQLHPPAVTVALTPFAALTRVVSDSAAFTVANYAFLLLGAVNAVLVSGVIRRLGLGGTAATVGGLFYALWLGSVEAEHMVKLEPLANALVLAGLLLALRAERVPSLRASVLAGVPLGLAVSVKIWWVVPVVAILAWHARRRRSAHAGLAAAGGAAAAAVALNLPFFAAAPGRMWTMVVLDQLGRPRSANSISHRLRDLSSVSALPHLPPDVAHLLVGLVALAALLAAACAVRHRAARPAVALAAAQLAVLLTAPSWYPYYCDYLAVTAAVVAGAAVARRPADRPALARRAGGSLLTVLLAAGTAVVLASGALVAAPFRGAPVLARTLATQRCVLSDSPAVQIRLDALSRGLAAGCPNWIDVTGPTYGPYRSTHVRADNPRWRHALLDYLRRGQAVVLERPSSSGAGPLRAELARDARVERIGGHTVYLLRRR